MQGLTAALLLFSGVAILGGALAAPAWARLLTPHSHAVRATSRPWPPLADVAAPALAATDLPVLRPRTMNPAEAAAYNAAIPISTAPNPPSAPLVLADAKVDDRTKAVDCLADAVYYEAASESPRGQRAVAQVVLNRLASPAFPKTVCGVVFQGSARPTGCQFTFTCDGSMRRPPTAAGWSAARAVAEAALGGAVEPSVGGATHYHTVWVAPDWSASLTKVANIGAHIFYVWPGANAGGEPDMNHPRAADPGADPEPVAARGLLSEPTRTAPPVAPAQPALASRIAAPALVVAPITAAPIALARATPGAAALAGPGRGRLPVPSGW